MYCSACGKKNPDDAKFCAFCGKPIAASGSSTQRDDEISWEYCQIQSSMKYTNVWSIKYECYFWADALGSYGAYCAGQTKTYVLQQKWVFETPVTPPFGNKEKDRVKTRQLLDGLVKDLQKDGWILLQERGPNPWSYKFKRQEKASAILQGKTFPAPKA